MVKKIVSLLLVLVMFIPLLVGAEECDISKVYIDSISVEDTSNVEELDSAVADDKTISLNLGMHNVGDNIKYKVVIKNDSDEDYELDDNINIDSDYVDYKIELDDDSKIVKKNSTKTIFLSVQYKNEVPEDAYSDGVFTDDVTIKVNMASEEKESIINPNTGKKSLLIGCLILLIGGLLFFAFRKDRTTKVVVFVIATLLLVPVVAKALCKCELDIHSIVTIDNRTYVYSHYQQKIGEEIGNRKVFDNLDEALADFGYDFTVRFLLDENNIILDSDLVFKIDDKVYYLSNNDSEASYNSNLITMQKAFGVENCEDNDEYYSCTDGHLEALLYHEFRLPVVRGEVYYCMLRSDGYTICWNE